MKQSKHLLYLNLLIVPNLLLATNSSPIGFGLRICQSQMQKLSVGQENIPFYEDFVENEEIFKRQVNLMGLGDNADLKKIMPALEELIGWSRSKDHLTYRWTEVGAGYGRVVRFLIDTGMKMDIEAYEQTPSWADFLSGKFQLVRQYRQIKIHPVSYLRRLPSKRSHVISALFGTIAEFNSLANISRFFEVASSGLRLNGVLIVDVPADIPPNISRADLLIESEINPDGARIKYVATDRAGDQHTWKGFLPNETTILDKAGQHRLQLAKRLEFKPQPDSPSRILYFFGKVRS